MFHTMQGFTKKPDHSEQKLMPIKIVIPITVVVNVFQRCVDVLLLSLLFHESFLVRNSIKRLDMFRAHIVWDKHWNGNISTLRRY